jgi:hypothetical protein
LRPCPRGRGSKTTDVFTPPQRVYDNYGDVSLSPQVPSKGAGIAVLAPIPSVSAGNINLVAPLGTIDAGEAGIRSSGNVNLAALQIVNAANIHIVQPLSRSAEPTVIRREKNGTAFFVDDLEHMISHDQFVNSIAVEVIRSEHPVVEVSFRVLHRRQVKWLQHSIHPGE